MEIEMPSTLSAAVNLLLKQVNTWWPMHNTTVPWSGLKIESPPQPLTEPGTTARAQLPPFHRARFMLSFYAGLARRSGAFYVSPSLTTTRSLTHARRVRFRDLETYRNSNQLRDL
jgi:hypothetical protein